MEELLQCLVDEDEADERGKCLLREASDVAHQRTGVGGNQHQTQQGRPQADASPQRQIGQVVVPDVREEKRSGNTRSVRKVIVEAVLLKMTQNGYSHTYLQNLKRIFSKTSTGPVLPRMVRGWPANREYATPVIDAPSKDSIALWSTRCKYREYVFCAVHYSTWTMTICISIQCWVCLKVCLCSYDASLCRLAQQSSKGDDRWHAGTVEEEEGGHTLEAHAVLKVTHIDRSFPLDVQYQTTK